MSSCKIFSYSKHILCILLLIFVSYVSFAQSTDESEYTYDTTSVDVFKGADSISFKLDYFHTDGISTGDRYWYELIVLDSLVILNFQSPETETWNYVSYQKRFIIDDSSLNSIKTSIATLNIRQKRKGLPNWLGSGYGSDKLFIDYKDLKVAGGTTYMDVSNDTDTETYKLEKQNSSSISGNYDELFKRLEVFFTSLPSLLSDCTKDQ